MFREVILKDIVEEISLEMDNLLYSSGLIDESKMIWL